MKKLILSIAISILSLTVFVSCEKSKEEKAKSLIEAHLKDVLNDPSSYKPDKFSKLDSNYVEYIFTDRSKELMSKVNEVIAEGKDFEYSGEYKKAALKGAEGLELLKMHEAEEKAYVPKFEGFIMIHRFRAKNAVGAVVAQKAAFFFDKDVNQITEVLDYD